MTGTAVQEIPVAIYFDNVLHQGLSFFTSDARQYTVKYLRYIYLALLPQMITKED